jgi:hypothetical protein
MEWTLKNIIQIVDETDEHSKVALSMPIFACALYVSHMKLRHKISVAI